MYTCIFFQLTKWLKEGIGVRKTPGYSVIVVSSCHYASFHLPLTFFFGHSFPVYFSGGRKRGGWRRHASRLNSSYFSCERGFPDAERRRRNDCLPVSSSHWPFQLLSRPLRRFLPLLSLLHPLTSRETTARPFCRYSSRGNSIPKPFHLTKSRITRRPDFLLNPGPLRGSFAAFYDFLPRFPTLYDRLRLKKSLVETVSESVIGNRIRLVFF